MRMILTRINLAILLSICTESKGTSDHHDLFLRSSSDFAIVGIGAKGISIRKNHPFETDEENKGLLISVVHEVFGRQLMAPYHFQIWADFHWLKNYIDKIQPGRIILISLRGEFSYKIPKFIKQYLGKLGSFGADLLERDTRWSWAFIKGGKTLLETLSYKISDSSLASTIQGTSTVAKSNFTEHCSEWPSSNHWNARKKFCSSHEGYGDLCSCHKPIDLDLHPQKIQNNQIESAVISAIAHRPVLLYESIKTLFSNQGFNKSNLRVFTPNEIPEIEDLSLLLRVPVTSSNLIADGSANAILRQYLFVIQYVLQHNPQAEFFIFLEDDVRYSPDFYIFLNRTAELLRNDPTLYCASAHNDISYSHTSFDATAVLRTESYPNCGWMVRREYLVQMLGLEEMTEAEADWDIIAYNSFRGSRECVVPEVSRSQHFGTEGTHVNSYKARLHFALKNFNTNPDHLVQNLNQLYFAPYENLIEDLVERSVGVDIASTPPCSPEFYDVLDRNDGTQVLAIYFHMETTKNFINNEEYTILAECLNIYSNSARESHFGLFRMRWGEKYLLLIGVPGSAYSKFKPVSVPVLRSSEYLVEEARDHSYRRLPMEPKTFTNLSYHMNLFSH